MFKHIKIPDLQEMFPDILRFGLGIFFFVFLTNFLPFKWYRFLGGGRLAALVFCIGAVAFLIYRFPTPPGKASNNIYFQIVAGIIAVAFFAVHFHNYMSQIGQPPHVDHGWVTIRAARSVFRLFSNPYVDLNISNISLNPAQRGYHYGPGMIFLYAPVAWLPANSIKIINLIYYLGLMALGCEILRRLKPPDMVQPLYGEVVAYSVGGIMMWFEILFRGGTDIVLPFLMALSLWCLLRQNLFGAGMCIGLLLISKPFPSLIWVLLLLPYFKQPAFRWGILMGGIPLIPFLLVGPVGLWNNVIMFHVTKPANWTSLAAYVPGYLARLFPVLQLGGVGALLYLYFRKSMEPARLLAFYILITTWVMTFSVEIHGNHFIWIVFPMAILWSLCSFPRRESLI